MRERVARERRWGSHIHFVARPCRCAVAYCQTVPVFFSCFVEFVHKHDRHRHERNRREARLSLLCPYLQSCVPPALHGGGRRVFGQEVE
jgi:hypothetical protein